MDTPTARSRTQSPFGSTDNRSDGIKKARDEKSPESSSSSSRPPIKKRQHSGILQQGSASSRRKSSSSQLKSTSSKKSKSSSSSQLKSASTKAASTSAPQVAQQSSDNEAEDEEEEIMTAGAGAGGGIGIDDGGQAQQVDREKLRLLLANFTEDQQSRYVAYRRANINRTSTKRLANAVLNQSISANVAIVISGIAKVFVGDIVDYARRAQQDILRAEFYSIQDNHDKIFQIPKILPPLQPQDIRYGWRLYKLESGLVPNAHWRHQGGSGDGLMFR